VSSHNYKIHILLLDEMTDSLGSRAVSNNYPGIQARDRPIMVNNFLQLCLLSFVDALLQPLSMVALRPFQLDDARTVAL
jgi:hypothetical protein